MKHLIFYSMIAALLFGSCTTSEKQTNEMNVKEQLKMTQEWDNISQK